MSVRLMVKPVAIGLGIVTATAGAVHVGDEFRVALDANTQAIRVLTSRLETTWSHEDHERWAEVLHALNPEIKMPPAVKKE